MPGSSPTPRSRAGSDMALLFDDYTVFRSRASFGNQNNNNNNNKNNNNKIIILTTIKTTITTTLYVLEFRATLAKTLFANLLFFPFFPSFLLPPLSFSTHTNTYTMSSTTHKPPKPKSFSASSATGSSRSSSHLDAESQALKNKYSKQLETLRELFPDWKDEDLLPVLAETEGSLEEAIERISSGMH